jgi:hypothetical protein
MPRLCLLGLATAVACSYDARQLAGPPIGSDAASVDQSSNGKDVLPGGPDVPAGLPDLSSGTGGSGGRIDGTIGSDDVPTTSDTTPGTLDAHDMGGVAPPDAPSSGGVGGSSGFGGAEAAGGISGTGGVPGTGGFVGTGGIRGTGGIGGTGGGISSGGATGLGGVAVCGDAVVTRGEACDLGSANNTGACGTCNPDCTLAPPCGNGISGAGGSLLTGLVAYYKCDSATGTTLPDSSGNGNNGTLVSSGGTGYTFSAGKVGSKALTLAKAGQGYVSLPPAVFANATDITIATWVYVTTSQNWQNVLDVGTNAQLANNTSTGTRYMNLVPKNGGTNLAFAISKDGYANEQTLTTTALPTAQWTHVAVVLTTGQATLYINGLQVAASSSVTLRPTDLGAVDYAYLGKSQFTANPYFDGAIDEFRVYGRALSSAEVAALTVYSGP